jgi:hypothetical protein
MKKKQVEGLLWEYRRLGVKIKKKEKKIKNKKKVS